MNRFQILWIDLRFNRNEISFQRYLREDCAVFRISDPDQVNREIREKEPLLLCFDYDYPDISSLSALRQAKCLFPLIPIIMLTEQHSESMAIWALRIHVWDYFVKPLQPRELMTSVATILKQASLQKDTMTQSCQHPSISCNPIPLEVRLRPCQKKRTYPAHNFMETHYHEKIYEEKVAQLCGMNASTFSRSFKKEYGTTFRNFLINYRITKARELLRNPNAMVTDIAYTVGFNDPSYFTRMFHRLIGISPSEYLENQKKFNKEEWTERY